MAVNPILEVKVTANGDLGVINLLRVSYLEPAGNEMTTVGFGMRLLTVYEPIEKLKEFLKQAHEGC